MNYNILKEILEWINKLKGGAMLYTFIFCLACCLLDFFYIRHVVVEYSLALEIFRIIYIVVGFFVHLILINNFFIFIDAKKFQRQQDAELKVKEERQLKEVERIVKRLNETEMVFVQRFLEQNSNIVNISQSEITLVGFICMKGLQVQVKHYYDVIQAEITETALYFLKLYFSEGHNNKG